AVEVGVDARPLGQLASVQHRAELRLAHEAEIAAIDLAGAGGPRRDRHRVGEVVQTLAHLAAERRLASTRRRRDDEERAATANHSAGPRSVASRWARVAGSSEERIR